MAIFLPVDLEGNLNIQAENTNLLQHFQRYNFELGLYSNNEKECNYLCYALCADIIPYFFYFYY